jgi:hypothetical protein
MDMPRCLGFPDGVAVESLCHTSGTLTVSLFSTAGWSRRIQLGIRHRAVWPSDTLT